MAYMNQAKKATLLPKIKEVLKKYNVKATFSVYNYSSLRCKITAWAVDFKNDCLKWDWQYVNQYWIGDHRQWNSLNFLTELKQAMNVGNHDRSDSMSDYFDVGRYTGIELDNYKKI